MLTSAITLLTTSTQTNAVDYTTQIRVYLSVSPSVIGVGQELLLEMWGTPAPGAGRVYHDYKLTIIKPDGTSASYNIDSYVDDGTMWMPYVVDQVGEWTFKLDYPGEYFAPGRYIGGNLSDATTGGTVYADGSIILGGSARDVKITVQEETIPSWPGSPLPTGYWTWPIGEENRDWWPIIGSYPWFGGNNVLPEWDMLYPGTNPTNNSLYGFVPWVTGPESAHVVWKRTYQMASVLGGDYGVGSNINTDPMGYSGSLLADLRMTPSIILMGRAYHVVAKPAVSGPEMQSYWECYDIHTGEIYWEKPLWPGESEPNIIEYAVPTGTSMAQYKPSNPYILSIANSKLLKYNPNSGVLVYNISIPTMTSNTYYMNGYVLSIQDLGADAETERYRLINWTTLGSSTNFASRVVSNTTYARNALPTPQLTDWNVGIGCTTSSVSEGGTFTGIAIQAFELYTGKSLWNKTLNEPLYSTSANIADHGKIAVVSANGRLVALDLKTGNQAWTTEQLDYPWDEPGWGAYAATSAYGQIYWSAQTGIYAIDWNTGKINWKFEKEAPPFETPYTGRDGKTVYPFASGSLCLDGKLYVYSQKHSPEVPYYRGSPLVCIDVYTGEEIWSIGMNGGIFLRRGGLAVAGGYMTLAARDGVMYTFGIGLSETTVSAPQLPLVLGQKALLTGTVLDLSPAQTGAPCVSKDSIAAQMEHIHMQTPIGGVLGDVPMVGVPVSLDAVDPEGKSIHIATITSDGYSGTFGYSDWIPETAGHYTITATFLGDESYDSSFATTYLVVAEDSNITHDADTDNTLL
ncbi:MAG: PQQ-binding-like beta-propeller repeat protein [Candidatus Bathyarchaeota archaeon]|nr:PQQ-binding-like beta-propeller repeat protein [Candidatus Termiticorpusculum sp.]